MLRIARVTTVLLIMSMFMIPTSLAGGAATTAPGTGSSGDGQLSDRCKTVLASTTARETVDIITESLTGVPNPEPQAKNDEIIVLLSESISRDGVQYSCGEIVSCLRQRFTGTGAEGLVIAAVKKDYPSCIISGKDGIDLLSNYASRVYQWIAGIVGAVCILVIIVSGIQISIGGLSQEEVSTAKDRVVRALVGMVVLFLSAFILYTINPIFFT